MLGFDFEGRDKLEKEISHLRGAYRWSQSNNRDLYKILEKHTELFNNISLKIHYYGEALKDEEIIKQLKEFLEMLKAYKNKPVSQY